MSKKTTPIQKSGKKSYRRCSLESCDGKHYGNTFCVKHNRAFKKWGDPLFVGESSTKFKKGHGLGVGIKGCKVEGCGGKHRGRGWCNSHYMMWFRHGDPLYRPKRITGQTINRFNFWHKKVKSGCWEWQGNLCKRGYGRIFNGGLNNRYPMAHRWAYEYFIGKIPKGLVLDHSCYNPKCVNPDHLEPVTHYENVIKRGRSNASYLNSIKTHCLRGHEFKKGSYYVGRSRHGKTRVCKKCHRLRVKKYKEKLRNVRNYF